MGAKKKKVLDPEVEARVVEMMGALKDARDIQGYCRALVVIGGEGEAAREAQWRLKPPFRSFGGPPVEEEGVISWSATHLLVIEEDLAGARVKMRRGGGEASVPASSAPSSHEDARDDDSRPVEEPQAPAGADPDLVVKELTEAFRSANVKHGKVTAGRRPGGGGCVMVQPSEGPKKAFELGATDWAESPAAIARGIVQAMGGEE